jgi:hypothetical protein
VHPVAAAIPPPAVPATTPLHIRDRRRLGSSLANGNAAARNRVCDGYAQGAKAQGHQSGENSFFHLLLHIVLAKLITMGVRELSAVSVV